MAEITIEQALQVALEHHRAGRLQQAEAIYRQILAANPDEPQALHWLGAIACQTRHLDHAFALLARSLQLDPNNALTHIDMGETLREMDRLDEAAEQYRVAIALSPQLHGPYNDLGVVYRMQRRYEEAAAFFQESIRRNRNWPQTHANLARVLNDLGRVDEAIVEFDEAVRLAPGDPLIRLSQAHSFLLKGDLPRGLAIYEARLSVPTSTYPPFEEPMWDGSDPAGRRIAVVAEQGLGDILMFCRYIPLLAARGARILFFCTAEVHEVVRTVAGYEQLLSSIENKPAFVCHVPLLSLPLRFGTTLETIPHEVPYLSAEPERVERWRKRLSPWAGTLRVGLNWAGSPKHPRDKYRSMALGQLGLLGGVANVTFFSLQKGPRAEQGKVAPAGMKLVDLSGEFQDFGDTAAVMGELDLVITVDTSVAHLAGALGRPVWTLLAWEPDFRWMMGREDTPWYPTMRLFRQPGRGDWDSVVRRVVEAMRSLARRVE